MDQPDQQTMSVLDELWSTPVGRRWVLKAGLGSLAAGLTWRPGTAAAHAAKAESKRMVSVALQFALDELDGVSGLVLIANGERIDLRAHTARSRLALRAQGGLWGAIDLGALSHYVEGVRLPAHRASVARVQGRRGRREVVVAEIWHAPEHATVKLANASHQLTGTLKHVAGSTRRLNALGLAPSDLRVAQAIAQLEMVGDSYQTASALTMTHPNIATIDPDATATTKALLGQTGEVTTLGSYIAQMQRAGRDFATLEPAVDKDGAPSEIKVGDIKTTFSTIRLNETDPKFQRNTRAAVSAGIAGVRDDPDLGTVIDKPLDEDPGASTKTWIQPQGIIAKPQPYGEHLQAQAGVDAKVKKNGFQFGTRTVLRGGYSNGKVPVKLYNNFVRWIWVYVQYLGADGTNLSTNPHPTFPDTKYSKGVCIVPQVFTVLGAPLWDTNTVEFTLDFPPEAHTARLLYCGMGSDVLGGGWRQYFPPDAYPGKVGPQDEVLIPALTTGIMTIGLNVFALATDIDIALTWRGVKKYFTDMVPSQLDNFGVLVNGALKLTAAESAAVGVVSGGALVQDILYRGETLHNMWNLIVGIASVIPKLLFNPRAIFVGGFKTWTAIGQALAEQIGGMKLIDAIPFLGQVFGVVSAVGDALTLAEVAAETVVSPWVIENEVSLSYAASVSVARDPRSSTFPASARSWRLDALVDGAVGLPPITRGDQRGRPVAVRAVDAVGDGPVRREDDSVERCVPR